MTNYFIDEDEENLFWQQLTPEYSSETESDFYDDLDDETFEDYFEDWED